MAVELVFSDAIEGDSSKVYDHIVEDAQDMMQAAEVADMELSLSVVGDSEIRALNSQWRGKDYATDVLSFPQDDDLLLGDLVISLETASSQAFERSHTLRDELRILMVHGLLHLFGYDHEIGDDASKEMSEAEKRLMSKLGWSGGGLISVVESD